MKEISDILETWPRWPASALATVVRVEGSSYRRPGARLLIGGDGRTIGSVSGGCIERDVILRAGAVVASGKPVLVRYESALEDQAGPGATVGCGGTISILIEPADTALPPLHWLWSRKTRGTITTVIDAKFELGARMADDEAGNHYPSSQSSDFGELSRAVLSPQSSLFVEFIEPPLELFIFGAGTDAAPLADLGRSLGWSVTIVDLKRNLSDLSQMPIPSGAAAVVMNHNWKHDLASLKTLMNLPLKYLGVLGPRHRTERMLAELGRPGGGAATLRYPVGLDLGAETPQEVALAIVAEITMLVRGGGGGALRDKTGPIHGEADEPCPIAAL